MSNRFFLTVRVLTATLRARALSLGPVACAGLDGFQVLDGVFL